MLCWWARAGIEAEITSQRDTRTHTHIYIYTSISFALHVLIVPILKCTYTTYLLYVYALALYIYILLILRAEVCTEVYFMQMNARVLPLNLILTTIAHTNEHICIYACVCIECCS